MREAVGCVEVYEKKNFGESDRERKEKIHCVLVLERRERKKVRDK